MDNQGEQKRVEELIKDWLCGGCTKVTCDRPGDAVCGFKEYRDRAILKVLSYGNTRYAEAVEASAKVAEETEKRSNSYNLYRLARFEIVRAIRSLLPSVDPTPAPVSSGGQSDDGLPVGGGKCKTCYWMGERFCEWDGDCINDSAYLADTPAPQPAPAKEENRDTGGGE